MDEYTVKNLAGELQIALDAAWRMRTVYRKLGAAGVGIKETVYDEYKLLFEKADEHMLDMVAIMNDEYPGCHDTYDTEDAAIGGGYDG